MGVSHIFKQFISYFLPIQLKTYHSYYSGRLFINLVNGKKILDTESVNYSFNSLHKVFKTAFKKTGIDEKKIKQALILGLGAGSVVELLRKDHQVQAPITAVDIDPVIIEIAKTEFNIDQYPPIHIACADAHEWMILNNDTFDIICVDLFINAEVPEIFLNREFIERLISSTNPGGTIYFNVMIVNRTISNLLEHIYQHLEQIKEGKIKQVTFIEVEENNRVLVITK